MVNGLYPVRRGQRFALSVRDGYKRLISKPVEHRNQVRKVEASVQRGDMRNRQIATDRKMKVTSMKMKQIKLINVLDDVIYKREFAEDSGYEELIVYKK